MAGRRTRESDDARFFGSVGPAALAMSAFGTSALVPLLLIAVIAQSSLGIITCIVLLVVVVWLTLRALRVGYRLEGSTLTSVHASRRAESHEIDLGRVRRTGRQRRDSVVLKMREVDGTTPDDERLLLGQLSLDSAARLRSVMEHDFGIDCATWGVTSTERARRDAAR